jgi:hypothetical protein
MNMNMKQQCATQRYILQADMHYGNYRLVSSDRPNRLTFHQAFLGHHWLWTVLQYQFITTVIFYRTTSSGVMSS